MKNAIRISGIILVILSIFLIHSCIPENPPLVSTTAVTAISYTTATSGGAVTDDGGATVTARGVCWNTAADPTTANNKTTDGTGTGSFVSNLISLQPGTIYYVRSYAANSLGTSYGNEISFTTLQPPTVTTAAATSLASTTATLNGTVNANNQSTTVTFEYGTTTSYGQTINAIPNTVSGSTNTGVSANLTGLTANTTYHFRVKAVSSVGTTYGSDMLFTTFMPSYTVTLSANPLAGGTTTGGGPFISGSSVTVTAAANAGYAFTNWTESGTIVSTTAVYTFTISGNRTLVANYNTAAVSSYTIAVSTNPSTLSNQPTGGGPFNSGFLVTVIAVANTGYTFTNWTESGTIVSTTASYTFTISGNRTLVANYNTAAVSSYTIAVSTNPSTLSNQPTGGGTFNSGFSVTVTAAANAGYTFTNWTESGTIVSTTAVYTFTISGNRTLVANFTVNTYTLTVIAVNGSVAKNPDQATYNYGTTVTLTATANSGYTFTSWSGDYVGTSSPASVLMNANKTVTANFTPKTGSDYYLPLRVGNYIKHYDIGRQLTITYTIIGTETINGEIYYIEEAKEVKDNGTQPPNIFRIAWFRKDTNGNILFGAFSTDGTLGSKVIIPTAISFFPNQYLTVGYSQIFTIDSSNTSTALVISTTATAGNYTNCIQIRETTKVNGVITLVDEQYYAYKIGLVKTERTFPANKVGVSNITDFLVTP